MSEKLSFKSNQNMIIRKKNLLTNCLKQNGMSKSIYTTFEQNCANFKYVDKK